MSGKKRIVLLLALAPSCGLIRRSMNPAVALTLLFVSAVLWVREVSAFAAFTRGLTGLTFTSSFRFPVVPLSDGIRHIHTLEHLENITWPYDRVRSPKPYFSIESVAQPQRYGDRVTTCVQTKVRDSPLTLYMLASPSDPRTCSYMCVQGGCQRALVELKVAPHGPDGHRLAVNCTYFTGPRIFDRDMEPVLRFMRFFEKRMRWHGAPTPREPRANLMWYRRMVLGKNRSSWD